MQVCHAWILILWILANRLVKKADLKVWRQFGSKPKCWEEFITATEHTPAVRVTYVEKNKIKIYNRPQSFLTGNFFEQAEIIIMKANVLSLWGS